ncbi:uncharacterized protein LOC134833241 [Culicoides brevitarsis]|uniref:uncharacterized protein LOC134833241 n=1 Tax=Culicoides brevitarsis TaxID=469753 RepID=UPI00307C7568
MKFFIVLLAVFAVALAETEEEQEAWTNFKVQFGKLFLSPGKEKSRKNAFLDNFRDMKQHNEAYERGEYKYPKAIGPTADLTTETFLKRFTGVKVPEAFEKEVEMRSHHHHHHHHDHHHDGPKAPEFPASMDLRGQAGVAPIKNQNPCGSCWAFSTLAAVEYAHWKKTGEVIDLSEQNLVDCVYNNYDGCQGGWMADSMNYIEKNSIATEADYPYARAKHSGPCKADKVRKHHIKMKPGKANIKIEDNDDAIKDALHKYGVLAICVDVLDWNFLYGFKDVFVHKNYNQVKCQHAVNLVGYNTGYWIVKNQWGTDWGNQGYIYLDARRDKTTNKNMGGFLTNYVWAANVDAKPKHDHDHEHPHHH